jgi:UDP-N-acetylglucosamine:LPS N-acetylglucosamine transferase
MPENNNNNKILAVASLGGHWMQLLRICSELSQTHTIAYVTTNADAASMLPTPGATLHTVADFSRWDAWRLPGVLWRLCRIIRRERPRAVITTGAAPGLMAILAARLMGVRTLWIDSIANAATLSGSGAMARRIAHHTFTQWSQLADAERHVEYHGNCFGTEA